jgi:flagellar hook-associated protein 3 FlgL
MAIRISSASIYANSTAQMNSLQTQMARTQMQISSNKRILSPSDDPVASARVLEVSQSKAMNSQFASNRTSAKNSLEQEDSTLTSVTDSIRAVQSLVARAGDAALSQADRESLATELDGRIADLVSLANTTDGSGGYLFSGYQIGTKPFTQTPAGATYNGDQGQRELQIGASRKIPISDTGSSVFENNVATAGSYATAPGFTNTGNGAISTPMVIDRTKITGHDYAINFTVNAGVTTYDVVDKNLPAPGTVLSSQAYVPGTPIKFDGMQMNVNGAPANGDTFDVKESQKQSLFTTLADLSRALRTPATDAASQAALTNSLGIAGDNLSNALDNVLKVQSSVGARLNEIDNLDSAGSQMDVQYASTLSDLQDLDMYSAYSLFTQQQVTLQAAQKSFTLMSGLSLFNYISG